MKNETLMGPWVRRFLLEHLVAERNLSRNTQASYRDTLTLLLPFASEHSGRAIDRMTVEDLTSTILRKFLDHVENVRGCSGVTRNHRLAAVHSLAEFIGMRSPLQTAGAPAAVTFLCSAAPPLQSETQAGAVTPNPIFPGARISN